ncbi:MAG: PAS domain S-box protein [Acidobacteria bacterium]|nr:PAS domain S-box protein [Acidobacteriota bacterium]
MKLSARIMAAMLALVVLTASAVGLLTYRNLAAAILPTEFDRLANHTQALTAELETSVRRARNDLLIMAGGPTVTNLIQARVTGGTTPRNTAAETAGRERLTRLFIATLAAVPEYLQFRLIGVADGGRELIRVNRSGANAALRVLPAAELERKGERAYFKEALQTAAGQVYASPIELNQELGVVEKPNLPMMRVATRVNDADGQPFGMLVINLDLRPAFAHLRAAARQNRAIYLLNERGDYLVHPQADREFGFAFGNPFQVQDEFPALSGAGAAPTASVKTIQTAAGQPIAVAIRPLRLLDHTQIVLLETAPYQALLAATATVRQASLLAGFAATLAAILLALVLTRSLTKPLVKMTAAVDAFRGDAPLEVPLDAGGELGVLARAFARMSAEVQEKTAALKGEITERQEAEDRFRLVIEAAPSGVVMIDSHGKIVLVNAETERLFGYARAELLGQSVELLVPARLQTMHAGHRGGFVGAPETRRMGVGRDLFGRRKDGSEFPIEIGLNPIQTGEGLLVLSVIVDITERKEAEERFRLVVEAAPSGMAMVDAAGKIIMVNAETERLFGYRRAELIGQAVEIFVPPRFRQRHPQSRQGYQTTPKVRSMGEGRDLYGLRKDGSEFPVEIGLNPISTPAGPCTLTTILDITERKQAEEAVRAARDTLEAKVVERTLELEEAYLQLKEVDRLKSEFLATMSHELRTPLNSIIGFTDILLQRLPGPLNEEQHKQLSMVYASGKHLLGLISDLLDLSRIESGKVEIARNPVNIEEVVAEVCNTVTPLARQKKLHLMTEFPAPLPVIASDHKRIFQVLLNLVSNAVKFTEQGEVKISGVRADGHLKLTVSDTGIGIKPENFALLFEAFRQIDGSSQRRYEGAGLGLHLSKRLVNLLGGEIFAESEYGRGSHFSFTLPLHAEKEGEA